MAMTVNCDGKGCSQVAVVRIRFHNQDRFVLPPEWKYMPTGVPANSRDDAVEIATVCSEACLRSLTDTTATKLPPPKNKKKG